MSKEYVSMDPRTFVDGGGLIDDVEVEFQGVSFKMHDLAKGGNLNPYLYAELKVGDETHEQYWSCGSKDYFVASPDGKKLTPTQPGRRLAKNSNAALFMASLLSCGFPPDNLDVDDIGKALNGMVAHVIRVPEPERPGLAKGRTERTRTILTVKKITSMPGERKGKGKKAEAVATSQLENLESKIQDLIVGKLTENPDGGILKKTLTSMILTGIKGMSSDEKREVIQKFVSDEWLGADDRPWAYKDQTVRLA